MLYDNIVNKDRDEENIDEKIKGWRISVGQMLLYSEYKSLSDLERDWIEYNSMHLDDQRESDLKSLELFGLSNTNRYIKMRSAFLKQDIQDPIVDRTYSPSHLVNESSVINAIYEYGTDPISKIEAINKIKTINENSIFIPMIKDNLFPPVETIYVEPTVPYFTPEEMEKLGVSYLTNKPCYSSNPDLTAINEKPIKKWYQEYCDKCNGYKDANDTSSFDWKSVVSSLYRGMNNLTGEALLNRKQSILDLGWNPEIDFNKNTIQFARKRFKEIHESAAPDISKDLTNTGVSLIRSNVLNESDSLDSIPLNIVFFENTPYGYNRIAFSLGGSFDNLKEVNRASGMIKTINPDQVKDASVITMYLDPIQADMVKIVGSKYNAFISKLPPLLTSNKPINNRYLVGKEFATNLIRIANTNFGDMAGTDEWKLANPVIGRIEFATIYQGDLSKCPINESKYCASDFVSILEVKELPVQFDDDGNLLISKGKKIDFEGEYSRCHMAMQQYDKTNSVQGMEYCITKLWYLNIILEEMIHSTKNKEKLKEYHKVRARIINDIKTYMPKILKLDSSFDILKAYNNSPFSDSKVKIRNSTIKYTLDLFKRLISLIKSPGWL